MYQTFKHDISQGLNLENIAGGRYLRIHKASREVEFIVQTDRTTVNQVLLNVGDEIRLPEIKDFYISCEPSNEEVQFIISDEQKFDVATSPIVSSLDSIGNILVSQLDKIINPYEYINTSYGNSITPGNVVIHNEVLTCDRIKLFASGGAKNQNTWNGCVVTLDNVMLLDLRTFASVSGDLSCLKETIILQNVKGKILKIQTEGSYQSTSYILDRYNKKV